MCVEVYGEKRQLYNRMRTMGINKNNNLTSKLTHKIAMFYKAILDKDKDSFEKNYKEIKNLNLQILEQVENYENKDKCFLMFDRDEGATKITDEGSYVKYCNFAKRNNDDIENIYTMVLRTPNWF